MLQRSPRAPVALALGLGVLVGVLTSLLQAVATFPWLGLVNAISPWLTTAFVAGALQRRWTTSALLGLAATVLEVVAYYLTAELRGFDASTRYVVLWTACAVVGGPVFGAAGHSWRRAVPAGLGGAALVAVWVSEGLVSYQLRLGYTSTAVLFCTIGALLAVGLGRHRTQYLGLARWLLPGLLAGLAGQALFGALVG